MKYLSIQGESVGFKNDIANVIEVTDIPISDEVYNRFFELKMQGKNLRVLNSGGSTFEEIFEEFIPAPVEIPKSELELLRERLALTEAALNELLLGGV